MGAPALTRHLVFWNPIDRPEPVPGDEATDWTKLEQDRVLIRKVQSDRLVAAIYRNLVERQSEGKIAFLRMTHPSEKRTEDPVPLFRVWMSELDGKFRGKPTGAPESDSYRALKIYFDWQGLPTVLSMELHAEFLTLTALIDLSRPSRTRPKRPRAGYDGFPDILAALGKIGRLYAAGNNDAKRWRPLHKFIYYDVWDKFEEIIFAEPGIDAGLKKTRGVAHPQRFIDFRGLLLAVEPENGPAAGSETVTTEGSARAAEWVRRSSGRLRLPFHRNSPTGTGNERGSCCNPDDFDRIWPFLSSGFADKNTEFTLSRYLRDRAFFATALAEQPQMAREPGSGPLCYLILEDTLNSWQLGRLVYRMHRGGTARVAAMMHFNHIQKAEGILSSVEHKLQESLLKATPLRDQDEDKEHDARESLRRDNDTIEDMLAGIPKTLQLDGSLDYRIERSRYYVRQFKRITKSLRIKRVQGFQTYIEFVDQRLGPLFDYIDRIGHRHARVQSDRGLLLRRLLTLEALYEERFISRAQRVADGALYGILGPYYLLSLIDHASVLDETYLWRVGVVYSGLYLAILALKPKRLPPVGSRRLMTRLRAGWPRRVWIRLAVSLVVAISAVTLSYSSGEDGLRSIMAPPVADAGVEKH